MSNRFITNRELADRLEETEGIERGDGFIVAAIKKSNNKSTLSVSAVGLSEWVEMPLKMIESAKVVGVADGGGASHPIALIKLVESNDVFAKVAYALLAQLNTVGSGAGDAKCCACQSESGDNEPGEQAYPTPSGRRRQLSGNPFINALGRPGRIGVRAGCHFVLRCDPCTRCIPFTNVCWSSTCCDLVAVDCDIEI